MIVLVYIKITIRTLLFLKRYVESQWLQMAMKLVVFTVQIRERGGGSASKKLKDSSRQRHNTKELKTKEIHDED